MERSIAMNTNLRAALFGTADTPCPPWCTLPAGHGYDTADHTCVTRLHSRAFGDHVALVAAENLTVDEGGGHIEQAAPVIDLANMELTAAEARRLAAALLDAADVYDGMVGRMRP
jgi:hypothetical protein